MKVIGVDPNTGKCVEIDIENPQDDFFTAMRKFEMSDDGIKRMIDNLKISADAKSLLYALTKVTIKAGEYIINIGRKIIDLVCSTFKEFPMATFGTVCGAIIGMLISSVPILGLIIGPIVTPLLMALGLAGGVFFDMQDKMLQRKITRKVAEFSPLAKSFQS